MTRLIRLTLTEEQRSALEHGYRHGTTHSFRQRCQMILLKSKGLPSYQIADHLDCCMISVNRCVVRYLAEGIEGFPIKKGRGRKAILSSAEDPEKIRLAVAQNRQRIGLVQAQLQKELGKEFSTLTLKRFLKSITADTLHAEPVRIQTDSPTGKREARCPGVRIQSHRTWLS